MNEREFIEFLLKQIQNQVLGDEPDYEIIDKECKNLGIDLDDLWTY